MREWPSASGPAAGLIRELDGSTNPLGPPPAWPQSLKTVVEDDYFLADDTCRALAKAGAEVVGPFRNDREGLAAAEGRALDAAVLDINTGQGPCFEAADALVERKVRVMFVTGYDTATIPERLRALPCLQKPVSGAPLVAAVVALCEPAAP